MQTRSPGRVRNLQKQCCTNPEDLLFFLNKWLVGHVVHEDLKIAEYDRNSDQRPIGENLYAEYLLSGKSA